MGGVKANETAEGCWNLEKGVVISSMREEDLSHDPLRHKKGGENCEKLPKTIITRTRCK